MTFVDLFCGIGGFRLGMEQAGHKCIWSNDIDPNCAKIYEKNFGKRPDTRDIREINISEIPNHDILCGGFPCQAFSIAGKREGFQDERGKLFFEIARIVRVKKPRYLFLENVKGLLSHNGGRTFKTIVATLDGLGYDLQWMVLNSKDFGVPQSRERLFIIGHLRGISKPRIFSFRGAKEEIQTDEGN